MKVSTSIRIGNIPALGTVALVPRGLWGLSENVLFLFGFMLSLARFVLGGRRQCLGLRSIRSRGNPRILLNPGKIETCSGGSRGGCGGWCSRLRDRGWPRALPGGTGSVPSGCRAGCGALLAWNPLPGCVRALNRPESRVDCRITFRKSINFPISDTALIGSLVESFGASRDSHKSSFLGLRAGFCLVEKF